MPTTDELMRPYHLAAAKSQAFLFANVTAHFAAAIEPRPAAEPAPADWNDLHTYEAAERDAFIESQREDWAAQEEMGY
jgi:hypothetical protein